MASKVARPAPAEGEDVRRLPKRLKLNENQADLLYWAKSVLRKQIAALPAKANIISRDQQFNDLLHQLQQLMSNTFNENISILLMGERGTGKTLVLRSVIRQMREDNPMQPLTEVYLNGFCVRDDSAALREIARQLQRASGGGGSAAEAAARDAVAAPAAATAKAAAHVPRTFAESMAELRTALEHTVGGSGSKVGRGRPIVLVLDEYDQFAAQNRQMLLYNLYNLIHDAGSRVAIVGVTSCLDATDHLEKRVKSRFSQRTLRFPPLQRSADYIQILQNVLQLPLKAPPAAAAAATAAADNGGDGSGGHGTDVAGYQQVSSTQKAQYVQRFNTALKLLVKHPALTKHVHQMSLATSDARAYLQLARVALSQLTLEHPFLRVDALCTPIGSSAVVGSSVAGGNGGQVDGGQIKRHGLTAREMTLLGLNRLELILIVAMTKLIKRGVDCFNFERVFDEYTTWVGRDNTTGPSGRAVNRASSVVDRQESKGTVLIAWERLMQQDLLTAMETSGTAAGITLRPEYRMAKLLVSEKDATWVVKEHGDSNDELRRWLDRKVGPS